MATKQRIAGRTAVLYWRVTTVLVALLLAAVALLLASALSGEVSETFKLLLTLCIVVLLSVLPYTFWLAVLSQQEPPRGHPIWRSPGDD